MLFGTPPRVSRSKKGTGAPPPGLPDEVVKKIAQNVAQYIFGKIIA
jgi:hypothetical protein